MEYEKQNFKNGHVLTADCLNRMEQGIADACGAAPPDCPAKDCSRILSHGANGHEWIPIPIETGEATIGDNAWSSKNIVDKLCPKIEATGLVVQCEPVEGYPMEVTAAGGGKIAVTVCGKNLFDMDSFPLTVGRYVRSVGDLTGYTSSSNYACTEGFIPVTHLRGKTITLNHPPVEKGGSNPKMVFYTAAEEGTAIAEGVTEGYTTTVPSTANFMRFSTHKDYADGTQIQIEIGSAVTNHEEYSSNSADGDSGKAFVAAVKGTNTVFAYSGDNAVEIAVSGRADPISVINALTSRVSALEKAAVGNT